MPTPFRVWVSDRLRVAPRTDDGACRSGRVKGAEPRGRRDEVPGTTVERWEGQLEELPTIEATLPAEGRREGDVVAVRLEASVSEVGVLELRAVAKDGARWKVALETR